MGRIFLRFSGRAGKDDFIDAVNGLVQRAQGVSHADQNSHHNNG